MYQIQYYNQADFLTSSTHTPTRDTYKTLPIGSAASVTKLIARSRSHGFPLSTAVGWLTPRRSLSTTTQTHTPPYSNVPWSWTRRVPQCLCLSSGVLNWAANVGVLSSPTRTGVRASRPPVGGLAFLRHIRLGAIMCSPPPLRGWGRAAPPL
jgi:hypothetical protein